jgi:putative ABC transport system permease protein
MNRLVKGVSRHTRRSTGRWAPVVILVAIGVAVYVGTYTGLDRIEDTTNELYDELALFDWNFRIKRTEVRRVPTARELEAIDGVRAADWRARFPGVATLEDGTSVGAVVVAVDPSRRPSVGNVLLTEGQYLDPEDDHGVIVDETFARDHGLKPGDDFEVKAFNTRTYATIRGIGVFPEYLVASVDEHMTLPVRGSLVAILASRNVVTEQQDRNPANLFIGPTVNDVVVTLDDDVDPLAARAALTRALANFKVLEVTAGQDQYSVRCHRSRLWAFRDFLPTVIALFEAMAAVVLVLAMHQLARGWRKEAGTLLAFGVKRAQLATAWTAVLVAMVAAGVMIGVGLSVPVAELVSTTYQSAMGFPLVIAARRWGSLIEACLLAALLVPVGWLAVYRQLRDTPRDLMYSVARAEPPGLSRLLARFPLGRATALGLRNVFRRPATALFTIVSAAGTLVMAGSMYLFADAQEVSTDQYLESRAWDGLVQFPRTMTESEVAQLMDESGITSFEIFTERQASVRTSAAALDISLLGWPATSRLQGNGWLLEGSDLGSEVADGILLTHRDLGELGAQLGDEVAVTVGDRSGRFTVVGVLHSYTLAQGYITRAAMDELLGKPADPAGAMVTGDAPSISALMRHRNAGLVLRGETIRTVTKESNAALVRIINVYGHLGTLAALILIVASMRVRARERAAEYGVLLGFGLPVSWLGRGLVAESIVLGVGAGLLAMPFTRFATLRFQARFAEVWMYVPMDLDTMAISLVLLAPVLAMPISALLPTLDLRRLNIVRALSTRGAP